MAFDWLSFFSRNRVAYVTSGPNVSKGRVACRCPWCGAADPSHHMSISLEGKGWRCWRNNQHRGGDPTRLVAALIHCSTEQAHVIVHGAASVDLPGDLLSRVRGALAPPAAQASVVKLLLPKEFLPFKDLPSARPFASYLRARGFNYRDIERLTIDYGVRYCTRGPFASRIIFPVYFQEQLVTWTGRTVSHRDHLRYKALSIEADEIRGTPAAVGSIFSYLLWYDQLALWTRDTLVICEGPFDALRVNVLGRRHGIAATCFFTSRPSHQQVGLFHELVPKFRRCVLLLDSDMAMKVHGLGWELSSLKIDVVKLPAGIKDPGELRAEHVPQIFLP